MGKPLGHFWNTATIEDALLALTLFVAGPSGA